VRRILIIQTAFLGDVILLTPLIQRCSERFPDARIDVLVKKGNESLLANHPQVGHVFTFDKQGGKWKNMLGLIFRFRKERYDLVLNAHRFFSSGFIACLSGAKEVIGFNKNPLSFFYTKSLPHEIGDGTHEISRNLSLLETVPVFPVPRPTLFPSKADYEFVQPYQSAPYFCLAPASVWFTKALPQHKWVELATGLMEKGTVYLLGAPSDTTLCSDISASVGSDRCVNLAGKLTLLQSAGLMAGAERCFVNDSAPLHMASAMNAPVTAFFCSTVPEFGFGPVSEDSVIAEVNDLSCRPCGLHGYKQCPKGHFKCGEGMNVSETNSMC
jgi:heptosyltransferase-2